MTRFPRCWIEIYDPEKKEYSPTRWTDLLELSIENTLYMAADSFEITLKNDKLLSDWLRKEQEIKIWLGYVANPSQWTKEELTHLFTGKIDGVRPEFTDRNTVQLIGRDYSAPLLDTEFNLAFANRTASQIATLLAEKRGLTPVVTSTEAFVAREIYKDKKEWEILQQLADEEGFICYVNHKKELYFGPRSDQDEEVVKTLTYHREKEKSNLMSITFDDSNIGIINKVIVRRWIGKKKTLVQGEAKNEDLIKKYGEKVRIVYGGTKIKTNEQAKAQAEKQLKEWSRSVVTAESVETIGDVELLAEKKIYVAGCGRFDGAYYIDRTRQRLSRDGFGTEMDLTTQRPDSAAQYRKDLYDDKNSTM